jgi:hypothetical protein
MICAIYSELLSSYIDDFQSSMQGNNQTRLLKPLLTQSTKLSAHKLNIYLPISYANNPLHISANLINRPSHSDQSLFSALTTAEKPSLIDMNQLKLCQGHSYSAHLCQSSPE